jgi:hypothetical protein
MYVFVCVYECIERVHMCMCILSHVTGFLIIAFKSAKN